MKIKKFSLILMLVVFSAILPGCYDKREVDDLTYVTAIGLDKGKSNFLRLTVQIAAPLQSAGKSGGEEGGGGGGGGGGKEVVMTVECPSLFSGLDMLNNSLSKQIFISHAKLIVISEDVAREGLDKYLHAMIRSREFRPSMYVAVSRGSAEEYIRSVKPSLESSTSKYYEMVFKSGRFTGLIPGIQLNDFYIRSETLNRQPVANLIAVSKFDKTEDFSSEYSTYKEKGRDYPLEGDFKAGDVPRIGDVKGEAMGLAVFDGNQMVGELDGEENGYYMMVTGEYNHAYWSIPDPKVNNSLVILNIKQGRTPVSRVEMVGGKPLVHVKITLEADIASIQSDQDYETNTQMFERSASNFLKEGMLKMLKKTSSEYHSDICGFGRSMQSKFPTWSKWEDFKWPDRYKDTSFDVNVDLKIRRPGLIIRSVPETTTEERKAK